MFLKSDPGSDGCSCGPGIFVVCIAQVRREKHVKTLQVRLELLKLDWWPCSLSAEVAVAVEYFIELVVELGVEMVDELAVDLLVG